MSQCEMIEVKTCSCGNSYKTDVSTLGVNRKKCGICFLKDNWIKEERDVVSLVWFFFEVYGERWQSQTEDVDPIILVKELFKDKVDEHEITNGIEKYFLSETLMRFSRNTAALYEIKEDVVDFIVREGAVKLIPLLLERVSKKELADSETKEKFLVSRPFTYMDAMEYLKRNKNHKVRNIKWAPELYVYGDSFGNILRSKDNELYSPKLRHIFEEWEVVLSKNTNIPCLNCNLGLSREDCSDTEHQECFEAFNDK